MKKVYVGVDIGGSHMEVALVDDDGNVVDSRDTDLASSEVTPEETINIIKSFVQEMTNKPKNTGKFQVAAGGIGCPGQTHGDILVAASNFPKFKNVPFVRLLSEALGNVPATLLNDADAAVSAEVWGNKERYGKYKNVAMITLGTGIGCGLILNGDLYQGSHGMIEAGHMMVTNSPQSRPCGCGQRGCVEAYSSAKNTVTRLQELELTDGSNGIVLDGKDVFARYQMNDYNAVKVVEETAEHLAVLSLNICRVIDPDAIVFGGGLSKAGDVLLNLIKKYVKEKTWTVLPTDVELVLAMSDKGGVVGSALASRRKYLSSVPTSGNSKPPQTASSSKPVLDDVRAVVSTPNTVGSSYIAPILLATTALLCFTALKTSTPSTNASTATLHRLRNVALVGQIGLSVALFLRK